MRDITEKLPSDATELKFMVMFINFGAAFNISNVCFYCVGLGVYYLILIQYSKKNLKLKFSEFSEFFSF